MWEVVPTIDLPSMSLKYELSSLELSDIKVYAPQIRALVPHQVVREVTLEQLARGELTTVKPKP